MYAGMAELADALDSGSSGGNFVEVQVLLPAPKRRGYATAYPLLFVRVIGSTESLRRFGFCLQNALIKSATKRHRAEMAPLFIYLRRARVESSSPLTHTSKRICTSPTTVFTTQPPFLSLKRLQKVFSLHF